MSLNRKSPSQFLGFISSNPGLLSYACEAESSIASGLKLKSEKVAMVKLGYKLNHFEIPYIRKQWTYLTHTVHHTQIIPKRSSLQNKPFKNN